MTTMNGVLADPFAGRSQQCDHVRHTRMIICKYLGYSLCANPVLDMLLELYASDLKGTLVSLTSLALAANIPESTALRLIRHLASQGFLRRVPDPRDGRRIWVHLSGKANAIIEPMLDALCAEATATKPTARMTGGASQIALDRSGHALILSASPGNG